MLRFVFNIDRQSANYGELRPVVIEQETEDGWTGRHAIQGAHDVRAVRHASWSRSSWTLEGRPSNDRLSFLALTLRQRAVAIWHMYQAISVVPTEWKVMHEVIDFANTVPRPDMATADDEEVITYLNHMNELRAGLENLRFALDIRRQVGTVEQDHGAS